MVEYKQRVLLRAWQDFKIKKRHNEYEEWTFSQSLYWAHKTIKAHIKNGK
jgi:hypothetical protein